LSVSEFITGVGAPTAEFRMLGLDIEVRPVSQATFKVGNDQPSDSDLIRSGRAALSRLETAHWEDWIAVILALAVLRTQALREAETNRPVGSRYRKAIASRLRIHGFDGIDKADRSRFLKCADNLPAIEAWRASQSPARQLALNHPKVVIEAWKRSLPKEPTTRCEQDDPQPLAEQLAKLTVVELLELIPESMRIELEDRLLAQMTTNAQASRLARTASFAANATNHLHVMLRCAEQSEPSEEDIRTMIGAGLMIVRHAAKRGIPRLARARRGGKAVH
jgi:hypothetical protein